MRRLQLCSCVLFSVLSLVTCAATNSSGEDDYDDILSQECLQKHKVLFEGECYGLLTKASCGEGEWLVLRLDQQSKLGAACVSKRCSSDSFYWPETDSCRPMSEAFDFCDSHVGMTLRINLFGYGSCECVDNPPHVRFRSDPERRRRCFALYSTGPCGPACQVQDATEELSGFGRCGYNRCYRGSSRRHRQDDDWLFRDEDGYCYRRNSTGPCQAHERFDIHPRLRKPACVDVLVENNLVNVPNTCRTDHNDDCSENEVTLEKNAENFKQKLFLAMLLEREKDEEEES